MVITEPNIIKTKKHSTSITMMQLIQFTICWFQSCYSYYLGSHCGYGEWLKVLMIIYQSSMFALFMQFYKKTSIGKSYNYTSLIVKIVLAILALSLIIFFLGKINFPAPNKLIKQQLPRENLKIVK